MTIGEIVAALVCTIEDSPNGVRLVDVIRILSLRLCVHRCSVTRCRIGSPDSPYYVLSFPCMRLKILQLKGLEAIA